PIDTDTDSDSKGSARLAGGSPSVTMGWTPPGAFLQASMVLASFQSPQGGGGTTEAVTAEMTFGASVGADVIDVFISAASEFATSAFSWFGSAVTGLNTFVSATFSWGTSLSAPRPTLLQRV